MLASNTSQYLCRILTSKATYASRFLTSVNIGFQGPYPLHHELHNRH